MSHSPSVISSHVYLTVGKVYSALLAELWQRKLSLKKPLLAYVCVVLCIIESIFKNVLITLAAFAIMQ